MNTAEPRRWLCAIAALMLSTSTRADRGAYRQVVDLRAVGPGVIVKHHHDWSPATQATRNAMITTHQDPFRGDNSYASLAWYGPDGALLRRTPCPALTWLGVTPDGRYVIGLSAVMLDNPYQVVVYDRSGALLLKRHITPVVACLDRETFSTLGRKHRTQLEVVKDRTWASGDIVYVDGNYREALRRNSFIGCRLRSQQRTRNSSPATKSHPKMVLL